MCVTPQKAQHWHLLLFHPAQIPRQCIFLTLGLCTQPFSSSLGHWGKGAAATSWRTVRRDRSCNWFCWQRRKGWMAVLTSGRLQGQGVESQSKSRKGWHVSHREILLIVRMALHSILWQRPSKYKHKAFSKKDWILEKGLPFIRNKRTSLPSTQGIISSGENHNTPERKVILVELHFQTPQCITSNPIVHFPVHVQWLWPSRVFPGDKCNNVGGAVRHWGYCYSGWTNSWCLWSFI